MVSRSRWREYSNAQRPLSQFHSSLTSGVIAGEAAKHLAAAVIGALRAAGRTVLAHTRRADQVERPRLEAVARSGERTHRADLHDVGGEVGLEGLVGVDRDLLQRAALEELDERVAGDLQRRNGCSGRRARSARGRAGPRLEIGIGFSYVRLISWKRDSPRPLDIAWFCRGHSPPLSQTGQSSGWLISSISIVPCCALSATAEVCCVFTTMSAETVVVQAVTGLRWPSTSTMHCRQAPMGSSSGWSQNRGIWMPICSAARMISVPFGTLTSMPSMVSVSRSSAGTGAPPPEVRSGAMVISAPPPRRARYQPAAANGQPPDS